MKKYILLILVMVLPGILSAQEEGDSRPKHIRGGFYVKVGPVIPVGKYSQGQTVALPPFTTPLPYLPANAGAALDLGFLIYLGPSFANNYLRAGIDATFISAWFNATKPPSTSDLFFKYYTFIGQKFGPVITVNPVNRLMLDISYKLNANFGYHEEYDGWNPPFSDGQTSEYGYNLFGSEVSLGIRYTILVMSFQYNFGNMNYNNIDNSNTDQKINIDTFRILVGLKF